MKILKTKFEILLGFGAMRLLILQQFRIAPCACMILVLAMTLLVLPKHARPTE